VVEKVGDEPGEGEHRIVGGWPYKVRSQADQFQIDPVELDDMVLRAPRVAVARGDLKAQPAISLRRRVEVAIRKDEMVKGAGRVFSKRTIASS
jgi:hypothetical protein